MRYLLISLCVTSLIACAPRARSQSEENRVDKLRAAPVVAQVKPRQIDKEIYARAVQSKELLSSLRLVPILKGETEKMPYPEYRVFGIKKGSPYSLLGLENADVLVAAEGFVVRDPATVPVYARLVLDQGRSQLEIRRGQEPILLTTEIVAHP